MKIFFVAGGVPFENHDAPGVSAVDIQIYQTLKTLHGLGHEISLQSIFTPYREDRLNGDEERAFDHISKLGIQVLAPIFTKGFDKAGNHFSRLGRLFRFAIGFSKVEDFYPTVNLRQNFEKQIRNSNCDLIFFFSSYEGISAFYRYQGCPTLAYLGDMDFQPGELRLKDYQLFYGPTPLWERLAWTHRLWQFKREHFRLMRWVDLLVNSTDANSVNYREAGHARSFYVGPPWKDKKIENEPDLKPIKIIGYLGSLGNTASTYGLRFLLEKVVPELNKTMDGIDYELHIIGGGEINLQLKPLLQQKGIVVRGWVKDVDHELKTCTAMLVLDNAGRRLGADTRMIVGWSMGVCLIAHENSRKAIPEIEHMENTLLGKTGREIAEMIRLATEDKALHLRLRKNGRKTFEKYFEPLVWTQKILSLYESHSN